MKKMMSLLCAALCAATSLVACTPKPVSAQPVSEEFIEDFQSRNSDGLAALVDEPDAATAAIDSTFSGLQAEGVDIQLHDVNQQESIATAKYTMNWELPRDRTLSYDTEMTLTKKGSQWQVRWLPSLIHPSLGAHQALQLRSIPAERASVVSSDGVELMAPGLSYRVVVDKEGIADVRPLAAKVSGIIDKEHAADDSVSQVDAGDLAKNLEDTDGSYSVGVYNEKQIEPMRAELEAIPGVRVNEEPALITKEAGLAPDILSRVRSIVSDDTEGAAGWSVAVVNDNGAALSDVEYHKPAPAPAVRIGLDYNVQRAAQEAVDLRPESEAMLVAIRPSTGEILAVAQTAAADKKGDIALQGQYPPGSVFKIITASAGIKDQGLNSASIVPCPGTMNIYGRTVTNYNGFSLGSVPLSEAFAQSCNTTFADISTKLDKGQLRDIGKEFGFGIDFDIAGLTTITGAIPEGETPLERTEAGYGQGADLASPFGMALVSATVAAGKTPLPTLIAGHETKASDQAPAPDPQVLDNVRTMMRQVVVAGTAAGMKAGGTIYGKTGEAEFNGGSHAWFTGYRDDDIAFATLVPSGGGSTVSVNITDSFLQKLDAYRAAPAGAAVPVPAEG
ncbi:MAG: penicillin-binding transpeptidase domain-containing protein [Corynebacterium flavescens]|uniref:penicillin-binding transpeptidase domain-containing protein n=1 Tax=Corynebacterium flavescens TaxID=28028 RepID=UPI003F9560E1